MPFIYDVLDSYKSALVVANVYYEPAGAGMWKRCNDPVKLAETDDSCISYCESAEDLIAKINADLPEGLRYNSNNNNYHDIIWVDYIPTADDLQIAKEYAKNGLPVRLACSASSEFEKEIGEDLTRRQAGASHDGYYLSNEVLTFSPTKAKALITRRSRAAPRPSELYDVYNSICKSIGYGAFGLWIPRDNPLGRKPGKGPNGIKLPAGVVVHSKSPKTIVESLIGIMRLYRVHRFLYGTPPDVTVLKNIGLDKVMKIKPKLSRSRKAYPVEYQKRIINIFVKWYKIVTYEPKSA